MKIITNINQIKNLPQTAIALGNFDGIHIGHSALIGRMVDYAREHGLAPAIFTFENNPINVLSGKPLVKSLLIEQYKEKILCGMGVEYIFSFKFDEGFHALPPESFIEDMLLTAFHGKAAFCGFNFRFGAEAKGDPELLNEVMSKHGAYTDIMQPYIVHDTLVSSSVIRNLVDEGNMEEVAELLGRQFSISGTIEKGNNIGRGLGFPTANIALPDDFAIPAYGVYVTESAIGHGEKRRSVTNVGIRPTVGDNRLLVETHIFGVPDEDLYGANIEVSFLSMIRPERRFAGMEELKSQVEKDKLSAIEYEN